MNSESKVNPDVVSKVFKKSFKSSSSKANKEATLLASEFINLFIVEAINRASEEQSHVSEDGTTLDVEHLERIVPQLLLDF